MGPMQNPTPSDLEFRLMLPKVLLELLVPFRRVLQGGVCARHQRLLLRQRRAIGGQLGPLRLSVLPRHLGYENATLVILS